MFKRVLLCYDGSEDGRRGLRHGAELALSMGSEISVLAIVPTTATNAQQLARATGQFCLCDVENDYRAILEESVEWLKTRGVTAASYLAHGEVVDVIIQQAKRLNVDLIVVGQYPKPGAQRWWSGTKGATLSEQAPCSVFISISH